MSDVFDLSQFDEYREDNRREVKKANGGLPISLWDTINNPKKVNINLLSEDDVQTFEVGDNKDAIMVIYVPMAKREQKPVYINNDIFNGTFRRNFEGDYHCTRLQVKTMLRDQTERTMDMGKYWIRCRWKI